MGGQTICKENMLTNAKCEAPTAWGPGPVQAPWKFWILTALWYNLRQFRTTFHVLANTFATFMSFLKNILAQINYIFNVGLEKSEGGGPTI